MIDLAALIDEKRRRRLTNYQTEPADVREHAGIEEGVLAGGYGYRQVLELVQNGADAILEEHEQPGILPQQPRIAVLLKDSHLYVANTGAPLSVAGVEALLQSHSSPKRGNQIGRFGLGFKSLLRLGGKLDIFSTTGSMRFDPDRCRAAIRQTASLDDVEPVPGLRLAWTLNRETEAANDAALQAFAWATTVVRAEICDPKIHPYLATEIRDFPAPFLLFLSSQVSVELDARDGLTRRLRREGTGPEIKLHDGDAYSRWRVVERPEVRVVDADARADATHLHSRDTVPLSWAMPLDAKRQESGHFWAFFPTNTVSRVPGILNAPWKLNSDRNALIPGEWNTALMREAARLVAEHLPTLVSTDDPGRPLDAFPRRMDQQHEVAAPLINAFWGYLQSVNVIADANGSLCLGSSLRLPPVDDADLHRGWLTLAGEQARARWVHPTCLSGDRFARLKELAERNSRAAGGVAMQATAADWFADIATTDAAAAKRVLSLADRYSRQRRPDEWQHERRAIAIIPTDSGKLCCADDAMIAPAGISIPGRENVLRALADDAESSRILTAVLGVKRLDDSGWCELLREALTKTASRKDRWGSFTPAPDEKHHAFWDVLRKAPETVGRRFIQDNGTEIRVRRCDGKWMPPDEVLLPDGIV